MSNTNEIASTLFRFVSLRNPEPPVPATQPIKYLHQAEGMAGVFHESVRGRLEGESKMAAMAKAAKNFSGGAFRDAKEVAKISPSLFEFSEWVLKNRATVNNDDLEKRASVVEGLEPEAQRLLWDNLFYQAVTSKSFYVKEAVMQLLLGDHVISRLERGNNEVNKMLVNARIALPSELFTEEDTVIEGRKVERGVNYPEAPDAETAMYLARSKAEFSNMQASRLLKELQKLEEEQKKDYYRAYEVARQEYDMKYKPRLDDYYKKLEEARSSFCDVRDPDTVYDPKDPCQQPPVVTYPDIPPFAFEYNNEIDRDTLSGILSEQAYSALVEAFGEEPDATSGQTYQRMAASAGAVPPVTTYSEVAEQVNQLVSLNNQQVQQNTIVASPQVSVGGVVLPATTPPPLLFDDRYSVLHTTSGLTNVYSIWFYLPPPVHVTKVVVTQHNADNTITSYVKNAPTLTDNGGRSDLNNIFTYTFPNSSMANAPVFDFDIYLASGEIKRIKGVKASDEYGVRGFFQNVTAPDAPEVPTPQDNGPKAFIPSGFGLKQLGIADYLKVEQSVHCYVEGEVSHIENIMGREYKEKATRRLRRTEETTTITSESERENLTDTSTSERFEMHSEVASVIAESQDMSGFVNAGYKQGGFYVDGGLSFANSSSSENSSSSAVTKAKEVTERAMDRVVSRMKEERIRKVLEEFEENNKHGFDNRDGSKHVVGVYRWVDKLYKNQVFNYGRRLMFEFMIPEPARLHILGMQSAGSGEAGVLAAPPDPRTAGGTMAIPGFLSLDETKASYWAGYYNAKIEAKPENILSVGESFSITLSGGATLADVECNAGSGKVKIPDGYKAISAMGIFNAVSDNTGGKGRLLSLNIGNYIRGVGNQFGAYTLLLDTTATSGDAKANTFLGGAMPTLQIGNEVPVSYTLGNHIAGDITVTVKCQATDEHMNGWKLRTFNAIVSAYEQKLEEYEEKLKEQQSLAGEMKKTNPGFYRQMENMVLRKNCISYLIDQNPSAKNTYGKTMFRGSSFTDYEVNVDQDLSDYSAFVKFMEQAFEWSIMSYNFFPYYWGSRNSWKDKYQFDENTDPLFRNFIQAGMAQVIVTVKPGFEEAVYYYLKTGKIWNGGQVPVIGDDMYMDIVSQVRTIPAEPVGKAWITRLPTDLTILQADSIGLQVEKALPCNCDDRDEFENPEEIHCSDSFVKNDYLIGITPDEGDEDEAQG